MFQRKPQPLRKDLVISANASQKFPAKPQLDRSEQALEAIQKANSLNSQSH